MRTSAPNIMPLFRSEMQMRLLGLLLLQPERSWTLRELASSLHAPSSSVHRELARVESAGLILRDSGARPHRFHAATDDPSYPPLVELLRRSVGIEERLRSALDCAGVRVALIYGSWATGNRQPASDIDVLVIGEADLGELRRRVRPVGKEVARTIDLTLLSVAEFQSLIAETSSFARRLLENPVIPLVGSLNNLVA